MTESVVKVKSHGRGKCELEVSELTVHSQRLGCPSSYRQSHLQLHSSWLQVPEWKLTTLQWCYQLTTFNHLKIGRWERSSCWDKKTSPSLWRTSWMLVEILKWKAETKLAIKMTELIFFEKNRKIVVGFEVSVLCKIVCPNCKERDWRSLAHLPDSASWLMHRMVKKRGRAVTMRTLFPTLQNQPWEGIHGERFKIAVSTKKSLELTPFLSYLIIFKDIVWITLTASWKRKYD